jgi:hypothetical protein
MYYSEGQIKTCRRPKPCQDSEAPYYKKTNEKLYYITQERVMKKLSINKICTYTQAKMLTTRNIYLARTLFTISNTL